MQRPSLPAAHSCHSLGQKIRQFLPESDGNQRCTEWVGVGTLHRCAVHVGPLCRPCGVAGWSRDPPVLPVATALLQNENGIVQAPGCSHEEVGERRNCHGVQEVHHDEVCDACGGERRMSIARAVDARWTVVLAEAAAHGRGDLAMRRVYYRCSRREGGCLCCWIVACGVQRLALDGLARVVVTCTCPRFAHISDVARNLISLTLMHTPGYTQAGGRGFSCYSITG